MQKNLRFLMVVAVFLALALGTWGVEAQQSMPGVQGSAAPKDTSVEGKVKKVDPGGEDARGFCRTLGASGVRPSR